MISGAIGGIVAVLLMTYLSKRSARTGEPGQLKYGWFLKGMGIFCALVTGGLTYVILFTDHRGQYVSLTCLILLFGLSAVYLLGEGFGTHGRFDAEGIEYRTPWSGHKAQEWSNLREVHFSEAMKWYVLTFADGTKIRISNVVHGHGPLLEQVRSLGHQVI